MPRSPVLEITVSARRSKYAFSSMKVGDWFAVSDRDCKRTQAAAYHFKERHPHFSFAIRWATGQEALRFTRIQ